MGHGGKLGWIRKWEGREEDGGEGKEGRKGRERGGGALFFPRAKNKAPCLVLKRG